MGEESVRVWLGAFGKHPGWDDHIADQGLETDCLVRVRRLLYVEGIGGNIDAGTWEGLEPDERCEGFEHVFLWRTPDGLAVGRLWSSSDGKGRTRYPMIVCAHTRGLACEWVTGPCLERLERLSRECREIRDAGGVIASVDRARQELREMSKSAPVASSKAMAGPSALEQLADRYAQAMGDDGLVRVCYQLEREFSSFLTSEEEEGTRSRTVDVRPRHMRVPACAEESGAACALWMRFLYERADPAAPALVFARRGSSFVDIVVGEPGQGQIFCFQASASRVPLTTEIPYNVDDEFRQRLNARIERARAGELCDVDPGWIAEESSRVRVPKPSDSKAIKKLGIVVGVLIAVIAIIWVAAALLTGSGGAQSEESSTPDPVVEQKPDVEPEVKSEAERDGGSDGVSRVPSAEQVAVFSAWCLAYDGWLSKLIADVRAGGGVIESNDYLSSHVRGPLVDALEAGAELDPRLVVSDPPATASELAEQVPDEIASARVVEATALAQSLIDEISAAIEEWPLRLKAIEYAETFASFGWRGPGEELRSLALGVVPDDGVDIEEAASGLVEMMAHPELGALTDSFEQLSTNIRVFEESGDRVLAALAARVRAELEALKSADSLEALVNQGKGLGELVEVTSGVSSFLVGSWGNVDHALFAERSRIHREDLSQADLSRALHQWLGEAQEARFVRLSEESDPRRGAQLADRLEALRRGVDAVDPRGDVRFEQQIEAMRRGLAELDERVGAISARAWNSMTRTHIESEVKRLDEEIGQTERDLEALRAAISVGVAERIAELKRRASVSVDGLAVVDRIWREGRDAGLRAYESDEDEVGLFRRVGLLSEALLRIESASRAGEFREDLPPGWDRRVMQKLDQEAREEAIGRRAEEIKTLDSLEQVDEIARAIVTELSVRREAVARSIATLEQIERHVDLAYAIDERWEDGHTIAESLAQVREGPLGSALDELTPGLAQALEKLEALESTRGKRSELLSLAGEGGPTIQAYLALGEVAPEWPTGAEELREDLRVLSEARAVAAGVRDDPRRAELEASLSRVSARRWAAALRGASDWNELSECAALQQQCGGSLEDLEPIVVFALGVVNARSKIDEQKGDQYHLGIIAELLDQASMPGVADSGEAVAGLLAGLRALAEEDPQAVPPLDPAVIGPGRVGWRVAQESSEEHLVYVSPKGRSRLGFRLVELDPESVAYIGTEELSVGVVSELVESDMQAGADLVELIGWVGPRDDKRPGMMTWAWRGSPEKPRFLPAPDWLVAWWAREWTYAPGIEPALPGLDSPVQRISLSDAVYLAGRLGCRLPTVDEWSAALAMTSETSPDAGWNLRDSTCARQNLHIAQADPSGQRLRRPDADAYAQAEGAEGCYSHDDGWLWVAPVDGGPDAPFRHIVGNVHEYVIVGWTDEARAALCEQTDPHLHGLAWWVQTAGGVTGGIVGGSVFSPVSQGIADAVRVSDVDQGWSDVGVRLAFSPAEGRVRRSVASRLADLIDATPLFISRRLR